MGKQTGCATLVVSLTIDMAVGCLLAGAYALIADKSWSWSLAVGLAMCSLVLTIVINMLRMQWRSR